ncbi:MAG: hypothetical protein JOZ62_12905 [Acidobacteriaceae bacterium]|nr:hypothetical protein [Acidobacteriaceae bacterium]
MTRRNTEKRLKIFVFAHEDMNQNSQLVVADLHAFAAGHPRSQPDEKGAFALFAPAGRVNAKTGGVPRGNLVSWKKENSFGYGETRELLS